MRTRADRQWGAAGYCLAELLVVLFILGVIATLCPLSLMRGLNAQEARSAAQAAQAAMAWAQTRVLWGGESQRVSLADEGVSLVRSLESDDVASTVSAPASEVTANVSRWIDDTGVCLSFLSPWASPDSGGSLFFGQGDSAYQVTVRPESGLAVRYWITR